MPAALRTTRLVSARIFGVSRTDPVGILFAAALMIGFGVLAGFLSTQRASRVDPKIALRAE
jgi:ABC-type antimicrobial peptide transport system permease subunit